MNFNLSAPRRETFLVSVVIAVLVVIGMIVPLPIFTGFFRGVGNNPYSRANETKASTPHIPFEKA